MPKEQKAQTNRPASSVLVLRQPLLSCSHISLEADILSYSISLPGFLGEGAYSRVLLSHMSYKTYINMFTFLLAICHLIGGCHGLGIM